MSRMVIVDDIQDYFKFHKENGILIKPFESPDTLENDLVLLHLSEILINIAKSTNMDIRKTLVKFREIILKKVTCI